jgi:ELWxxDGT repeat protein
LLSHTGQPYAGALACIRSVLALKVPGQDYQLIYFILPHIRKIATAEADHTARGLNDEQLWLNRKRPRQGVLDVQRMIVVESGTKLFLDRDAQPIGSPTGFRTVGDTLMFTASDGVNGYEPWFSDSTADGTHMVRDINPGAANSKPSWQHVIDGKLYFEANDGVHGNELWVTDGTEAGTYMIKDASPGIDNGYICVDNDY